MNPTTNRAPHDPGSAPAVGRSTAEPGLGGDLLRGADAIAEFLFGDRRQRRRVYYLTGEATGRLPTFDLVRSSVHASRRCCAGSSPA